MPHTLPESVRSFSASEEAEAPHATSPFNAGKNRIEKRGKVIDLDQSVSLTNFSNLREQLE
jgi:hypothetical protein